MPEYRNCKNAKGLQPRSLNVPTLQHTTFLNFHHKFLSSYAKYNAYYIEFRHTVLHKIDMTCVLKSL